MSQPFEIPPNAEGMLFLECGQLTFSPFGYGNEGAFHPYLPSEKRLVACVAFTLWTRHVAELLSDPYHRNDGSILALAEHGKQQANEALKWGGLK